MPLIEFVTLYLSCESNWAEVMNETTEFVELDVAFNQTYEE